MNDEPTYGIEARSRTSLELYDGTDRPISAALLAALGETVEGFTHTFDGATLKTLSYSGGECHVELEEQYDDTIVMEDE